MAIRLRQESALNLTLEGSAGSFRVGSGHSGQNSLEVKYLLTYVGLNFSSGSNDALLDELVPVREIFDFNMLDFDEIMQRDIDDARVSADLIPYLLDEKSTDLIKLFPPIVVVVMPIKEDRNKPADLYPEVFAGIERAETSSDPGLFVVRSGAVGQEVFQFEQPVSQGKIITHDLVRLKLNTHRIRLVIVDGQHRAMALLAIYRNLKEKWSDEKRAPYKEYYSIWTPDFIGKFNLVDINIPIMLCTVPSLDEQYKGYFDLKKSARSIFLVLNKNARKVSDSRNILLDDSDIIAFFLRITLSEVKRKDTMSPYSFRIYNIELDQFGDKLKIQSPVAITGVNHIYYIIEHMLLNDKDIQGIKPRSGRFSNRKYLADCLDRLDGRNYLGSEVANTIDRRNFSVDAAKKLGQRFNERYGTFIVSTYEKFAPFENHNRAALQLESQLEADRDRQLRPILFEGQGIGRVFETHRVNLSRPPQDSPFPFTTNVPAIEASVKRLDASAERILKATHDFRADRASMCLSNVSDKAKIRIGDKSFHSLVIGWFNALYDEIFFTVAFQSALICGFFGEIEIANRLLDRDNNPHLDSQAVFSEYMQQLNAFFIPKNTSHLKRLIRVFGGEVEGETADEWKIAPSNQTFRNVVYRGEMQPAQWTKYRYLLLELWKPSDPTLSGCINKERHQCREQVFSALYDTYKLNYCQQHLKLEDALKKPELDSIFDRAFTAYSGLLKNLDATPLDKATMQQAVLTMIRTVEDFDGDDDDS